MAGYLVTWIRTPLWLQFLSNFSVSARAIGLKIEKTKETCHIQFRSSVVSLVAGYFVTWVRTPLWRQLFVQFFVKRRWWRGSRWLMTAWRVSWCGVHSYELPHKHPCKKSINKQINTTLSKWREVLWWESTLLPSHDVQRSNPILFIFLNVLTFMRFYVFKLSRGPRFDYGLSPFFWFIKFFIFINFFHPWHDYFLVVDRDESTQMLQSCGPDCDECNKSLQCSRPNRDETDKT
jgi:hypothetical protein